MSEQSPGHMEWIRDVLEQHEGALLRYAWRLTGDAEKARDIVQETFLRLCRVERASLDGHLGPWLFRVCRQRALDAHRKEQHMPAAASHAINGCASKEPGPADRIESQDDTHDILRRLATMPANQQEVVRLKFQSGLSYREISDVTGLSVSNVGFLLHTALARLREQVAAGTGDAAAVPESHFLNGNSAVRNSKGEGASNGNSLGGPDNLLSGRR